MYGYRSSAACQGTFFSQELKVDLLRAGTFFPETRSNRIGGPHFGPVVASTRCNRPHSTCCSILWQSLRTPLFFIEELAFLDRFAPLPP